MLKHKEEWWVYLRTFLWLGPFTLISYLYTNWRTDQITRSFDVYLDIELKIPFVFFALYFYVSLVFFFVLPPFILGVKQLILLQKQLFIGSLVSLAFYYIFPSPLAFIRPEADNFLLNILYQIDRPNNASFSIFQLYLGLICLSLFPFLDGSKKVILIVATLIVGISGLLLWQQHLIGIMTAWVCVVVLRLSIIENDYQV